MIKYITDTFLKLTSKTVPYGYEEKFVTDVLLDLFPKDTSKDKHGNYFYKIGDSKTIFASHIDTVSTFYTDVKHCMRDFKKGLIRTKGDTTLGADDKAGMTIMLWMIKNEIPGLYYFFIGEEVGCIGSGLVASFDKLENEYDKIISFDRRGTNSVITHQSSGRSCSDNFADDLCDELNKSGMSYIKDTGGVYTDSAEFMGTIAECTNISVGYYLEHTKTEYQDIHHLIKLANACISVDWENLRVERKPEDVYTDRWNNLVSYGKNKRDEYDDSELDDSYYSDFEYVPKRKRKKARHFFDDGSDLTEIMKEEKYEWVIEKLTDSSFTLEEIEMLKLNYIDMCDDDESYSEWYIDELRSVSVHT